MIASQEDEALASRPAKVSRREGSSSPNSRRDKKDNGSSAFHINNDSRRREEDERRRKGNDRERQNRDADFDDRRGNRRDDGRIGARSGRQSFSSLAQGGRNPRDGRDGGVSYSRMAAGVDGGGGRRGSSLTSFSARDRDRDRDPSATAQTGGTRYGGGGDSSSARLDRRGGGVEQPPRAAGGRDRDSRDRDDRDNNGRTRGSSDYARRDHRDHRDRDHRGEATNGTSVNKRRDGGGAGAGEDRTEDASGRGDGDSKKSKGIFSYIVGGGGNSDSIHNESSSPAQPQASTTARNGDVADYGPRGGSGAPAAATGRGARPNSMALSSILRSDRRTNNRLDREQFDGAQTRLRKLAPEGDEVKDNFRYVQLVLCFRQQFCT